jgi:hypothetical protein
MTRTAKRAEDREGSDHMFERLQAALAPMQWAERELEQCRLAYARGDKRCLAIAIQICGATERILPSWVVSGFNEGLREIIECRSSSWNDVLGAGAPPTETRRKIAERNRVASRRIVDWLAKDRNRRRAIDTEFWEALGKHCKVSADQARKLYYRLPKGVQLPAVKRRGGKVTKSDRKRN